MKEFMYLFCLYIKSCFQCSNFYKLRHRGGNSKLNILYSSKKNTRNVEIAYIYLRDLCLHLSNFTVLLHTFQEKYYGILHS